MKFSAEEKQQIAKTIISQMGGAGRLSAMIAFYNVALASDDKGNTGVSFHFRGSRKATICQVIYNYATDLYDVKLYRIRKAELINVAEIDGAYCDQLVEFFESNTGLYLSL